MKKYILVFAFALLASFSWAQSRQARKFARTITESDLQKHLGILASDSLQGRGAGTQGTIMASEYIAGQFAKAGLEPSANDTYFQDFPLLKSKWSDIYIKKDEVVKKGQLDFLYFSEAETMGEEVVNLIWIDEDTDTDIDIQDKFVVFARRKWSEWDSDINKLKEKNPAGFVIVVWNRERLDQVIGFYERLFTRSSFDLSVTQGGNKTLVIDTATAAWLFEKPVENLKIGDKAKMVLNADRLIDPLGDRNVLGFLPGGEKPQEILIVTSHYDHLGTNDAGDIFNGADDDGSGTVAILELAEAFAKAAAGGARPKRSILFMTVSGEEKGLLGSRYYTENPVYPLEQTVSNLNIDMIGRDDEAHSGGDDYVYVIGSDKLSADLHQLSEQVNASTVKLDFDYTYNDENDPNRFYYRSDHYNFAKNNVPIIFYFNGTHADYHKATDTIEKIDFRILKKRAELVFYTAWEIANREERIKLD